MTHIPRSLVELFAKLHVGDEILLNRGPGEEHWKIELLQCVPPGKSLSLPSGIWQGALLSLSGDWQGSIRFYYQSGEINGWRAVVKTVKRTAWTDHRTEIVA